MFDFIPGSIYADVYYYVMLVVALVILLYASYQDIRNSSVLSGFSTFGLVLLGFLTLYMGLRPLHYKFVDMVTYHEIFMEVAKGKEVSVTNDYIFNYFMVYSAKIMDSSTFFLLVDIIYIIPCFVFSRKYFGSYWFFAFFMFIASYSFWSFGTNGIRNGMATSVFILALCFYERKILMYALMAVAYGFHNSLIIPVVAFVVSGVYKNPKVYLYIWLSAIPLSLIGGNFWGSFFSGLGFDDKRVGQYLNPDQSTLDQFSQTGFRWDFVVYSALPVIAGWYFIFRKQITDRFYIHLWGTYMIANAFWILVIRAAFSNRFAYLSWFLMAPVIIYPLVKYKISDDQFRILGYVIFGYYLFTFVMFLLY